MNANILKWILVGLFACGALLTVNGVGKPRKEATPTEAAVCTLVNALLIAAILRYF